MNNFSELNDYGAGQVTFQSQADYSIVFGNSLGNGSVTANNTVFFTLQNRQPIISFTNPLEPLVVSIIAQPDLNGACINTIQYVGNNANITISNPTAGAWVAQGMWTVADYNELFANGVVELPALRTDDFVMETTANDQLGNTRSFYTEVDVIPGGFSRPNTVSFDEDTTVQIDGMGFSDLADQNYTFTFGLVPTNSGNILLNATAQQGNTIVSTGTRTQINTRLQGNIAFIPADDYAANAVMAVNIYNNTTSTDLGYANIALQIAATHAESSYPSDITYSDVGNIAFNVWTSGNSFAVTDQAVGKNYSLTFNMGNTVIGNLYQGNTLGGSSVTLTGNKAAVNSAIGNVLFVPNGLSTANASLVFTQTQTTANILQTNVTIPMINQIVAQHANDAGPLPVGQLYTTGNAQANTANTSFSLSTYSGASGNVLLQTLGNTITPAAARVTTNVKYSPISIRLSNQTGLQNHRPYLTAGSTVPDTCYFAFWVYFNGVSPNKILTLFNSVGGGGIPAGHAVLSIQFSGGSGFVLPNDGYVVSGGYYTERLVLGGGFELNTWNHIAVQRGPTVASGVAPIAAWVNGQPQTSAFSGQGLGNPGFAIPYISGYPWNKFRFGRPGGPVSDTQTAPFLQDFLLDDIVYQDNNPYTAGVAFTPQPLGQFTGNIRMMMTGC